MEQYNRGYSIVPTEDLPQLDWWQLIGDIETVRKSNDGLQAVVEYNLPTPPTIAGRYAEYDSEQMREMLVGTDWEILNPAQLN